MSEYETIIFEKNAGIAKIILNRPDKANGIMPTLGKELLDASIRCAQDSSVRVVILTANGKMFSAGGDLKAFASFGETISAELKKLTTDLHAAISNLVNMNAPLIVGVNGMAAGAGFSLALIGDYVIAAESSKFTMAYTAAGLSPDGSSSYFLPRLVGLRKTQELMINNPLLSAEEALNIGLINRVVTNDELDEQVNELAQKLASGPTLAYGMVKKLLAVSFNNGLETQMELEGIGISAMAKTEDGKEGIAAFLEKRKPEFIGR